MRLAVYTDYEYRSEGGRRYGQRAFVVFLEALRPRVERLVFVGRLDPQPGRSHYPWATTPSSSACPTTTACSRRGRWLARSSSR